MEHVPGSKLKNWTHQPFLKLIIDIFDIYDII